MSTFGIIAIKGENLSRVSDVLKCLKYLDDNDDQHFENWSKFERYLNTNFSRMTSEEVVWKGFWEDGQWLIIYDPDLENLFDIELLFSSFKTEILTFFIQTTSATYGFAQYENLKTKRNFIVQDGEIIENEGKSLLEERDCNMNGDFEYEDVISIANNFNLTIDVEEIKSKVLIKFLNSSSGNNKSDQHRIDENKPWWKFW